MFHVSLLQKHLGTNTPTSTQLLSITDDSTILSQPKVVLDYRVIRKGKYRPKSEILVKWKGALVEEQPRKMSGVLSSHILILS